MAFSIPRPRSQRLPEMITAAASKLVDGQHTVVVAALAPGHGGGVFQADDLIQRQHGGLLFTGHVEALPGDQGSAEGAHDAGDVRADCLGSRRFSQSC